MTTVTRQWFEKYKKTIDLLVSPVNFSKLFTRKHIKGKRLHVLPMGTVTFTTDRILARDPLVRLKREEEPYFTRVPVGEHTLETLVMQQGESHYRYVATRVRFQDRDAEFYCQALEGDEDLDAVDDDSIFGFEVDSGLATIVDTNTRDAYCDFVERWYRENPGKNIYDNFFATEFRKSYIKRPEYQTEEGNWINFRIPHTDYTIPMIQSGFGDGYYPVYFGYDEDVTLVEVVIEYIFVG